MLDKRLTEEAKNYRQQFFKLFCFGILHAVSIVLTAYHLTRVIDGVFLKDQSLTEVVPFLAVLLFVMLGKSAAVWLSEITACEIAGNIKDDLRMKLIRRLAALGPVPLAKERAGELVAVLTEGIDQIDGYFTKFLPQLITAAMIPLTILAVVLTEDLLTAFIFIATAPLIPIFMILIGKLADKANAAQWKTLSRLSAHFLDVMQGLTTLKIFNQSIAQVKMIEAHSNAFRDATLKVLRAAFLSAFVLELAATLSVALIAVTIGLRLLEGQIAFAHAFFLLLLAPEFYAPLRQMGTAFHAAMSGASAAERIYEILARPDAALSAGKEKPLPEDPIALRFENVAFSYQSDREEALSDFSLTVARGEHAAIVGTSGAGKSTIIHLLLKFIRPARGEIFVNGQRLSDLSPALWRERIAYVPQEPHMFSMTIAENIAIARPGASPEEIAAAARKAKAHAFIAALPDGYETKIGEGGQALSGGQTRRIAIARAFLQDAPLVLFDEATTGLDVETEAAVEESLAALTAGKTLLTIAHRLRSVRKADKIIVVERGAVVEIGTHDALIAKRGMYFSLLSASGGMA